MKLLELDLTPTRKLIQAKPGRYPELSMAFSAAAEKRAAKSKDPNLTRLGEPGAYATAYKRSSTPGVVTKVGRFDDTPAKDGYLSYLQSILHNDRVSSNPFLPRIYSIKVYKYPSTEDREWRGGQYVVQMEKLRPIDELSIEQLEALGEHLFKDWEKLAPKGNAMTPAYYAQRLLYTISMATSTRNPRYTRALKDKKLLQAVAMISNLGRSKKDHTEIEFDLHAGNFMYRVTPVGPQLVITDPLA